ncbi:unnamed protein product [Triticum turgidum subsp. durum]|uniref:Uncharacterized protein n=1 Tax=Triticum turgidum subsp. durum TaxID=4567 RepID=A0A9R0Z3P9_TRITD|nr:unnamed protein product [Triticum turgidum subsp. durum]
MSVGHRRLVSGEEFEDYLEHPDPVPLALFLRSEASHAVPADSNAGLQLGSAPPDQTPCPWDECSQLCRGTDKECSATCTCSGEAYDFYNLYTWEIGFGIRYDKIRLNAERTKCMEEIVCGCSVPTELCLHSYI